MMKEEKYCFAHIRDHYANLLDSIYQKIYDFQEHPAVYTWKKEYQ